MIEVGQPAPDFTLPDSDMRKVSLSGFKNSKNIVLYFYPKDFSSNSTKEAIEFTDLNDEFEALDTVIIGVSTDSCMRHAAFRDEHGLSVLLLADMEGEICNVYGALRPGDEDGLVKGIMRSTFIIDKQGIVRDVQYGIKSINHADDVLNRVKALINPS